MANFRETVRLVSLGASGSSTDTVRVYDAPSSEPFHKMNIVLSSAGQVLPAGNLDWKVFVGGNWKGVPFESVHAGGFQKYSGTIAGGTEVASTILAEESACYPANRRYTVMQGSEVINKGENGLPVVVELKNNKASAINVWVTFTSRTMGDYS